jgi:hypothetical protein
MIAGCTPQSHRSMPAEHVTEHQKVIEFSGRKWLVANSNVPVAPGPNFWAGENVSVDDSGRLHLKVVKNENTGIWTCAAVSTMESLGLGQYEFLVEGNLDKLDKNIVAGLFCYSGNDTHDEIDIEFSSWGINRKAGLLYSVWPAKGKNAKQWSYGQPLTLEGNYTTHRFSRNANTITFQSLHGFRADDAFQFSSAVCRKNVSKLPMPVYINLWLYKGKPPPGNNTVELIIHAFRFTPG